MKASITGMLFAMKLMRGDMKLSRACITVLKQNYMMSYVCLLINAAEMGSTTQNMGGSIPVLLPCRQG